jgi:hypothetical protein
MIGNISIALTYQELMSLIDIRNQYRTQLAQTGQTDFNKTKIVVINDTDSYGDNYIVGSILLPDSKAMFSLIEGDYEGFQTQYYRKLESDPQIHEYLVVLLAGLIERGFDYIFYFDSEDPQFTNIIASALATYLYFGSRYGISVLSYNDYVMSNPNIVMTSSVNNYYLPRINDEIRQYKLSNKPESLFIEF